MAINPIFIDKSSLKARLRLSGSHNSDSLAAIDQSIQTGRTRIFDELGETKVASLLQTTLEENPTTTSGIVRLKASLLEVALNKLYLLRNMPTLFLDSAVSGQESWNDDEMIKENPSKQTEREISRLEGEILRWIDEINGEQAQGVIEMRTIGPASTPFRPWDSIREE